jgi:hypothetical protein
MTAPAVWLLDFDGVVNGGSRPGWHAPPRTTRVVADGQSYRIRWAPQAIEEIVAVHATGLVEIRWASSWIDVGTDGIERAVGLPPLPHAYPADLDRLRQRGAAFKAAHTAAKTAAALDVVASGRRLIWTDDDAIPTTGPAREALDDTGALLVIPTPGRALRPEHLASVRTFMGVPEPGLNPDA